MRNGGVREGLPFWTESRIALRRLRGRFRLSFRRALYGRWTYADKIHVSRKYPVWAVLKNLREFNAALNDEYGDSESG